MVNRLLLAVGEEKKADEELGSARADLETKCKGGFPELFYQEIPFLPAYIAAGNSFQWAYIDVRSGQVSWVLSFSLITKQALHLNRALEGACNPCLFCAWQVRSIV